jgi:hypothetical protein
MLMVLSCVTVMSDRFRRLIAAWFLVQIVVPFTAPLQTCDVHDLFGPVRRQQTSSSPECSSTPTISESETGADSVRTVNAWVSPIPASHLGATAVSDGASSIALRELTARPHQFDSPEHAQALVLRV